MQHIETREFHEHLSTYLEASTPVAVTRSGKTIGFYIPAKTAPAAPAGVEVSRQAAHQLVELIVAAGLDENALMEEVKQLCKAWRQSQQIDRIPDKVIRDIEERAWQLAAEAAFKHQENQTIADWRNSEWQDFSLGQFFREEDEVEYTLGDAQEIYKP